MRVLWLEERLSIRTDSLKIDWLTEENWMEVMRGSAGILQWSFAWKLGAVVIAAGYDVEMLKKGAVATQMNLNGLTMNEVYSHHTADNIVVVVD